MSLCVLNFCGMFHEMEKHTVSFWGEGGQGVAWREVFIIHYSVSFIVVTLSFMHFLLCHFRTKHHLSRRFLRQPRHLYSAVGRLHLRLFHDIIFWKSVQWPWVPPFKKLNCLQGNWEPFGGLQTCMNSNVRVVWWISWEIILGNRIT